MVCGADGRAFFSLPSENFVFSTDLYRILFFHLPSSTIERRCGQCERAPKPMVFVKYKREKTKFRKLSRILKYWKVHCRQLAVSEQQFRYLTAAMRWHCLINFGAAVHKSNRKSFCAKSMRTNLDFNCFCNFWDDHFTIISALNSTLLGQTQPRSPDMWNLKLFPLTFIYLWWHV